MLFEPALPDGMRYQADFLTHEEERALLDEIRQVTFAAFEMRG
ncbi:MAG: alpha-ketoglutarate-dependent dioxygenase AlkB, partial [Acidobacteria bacterium]|nr:alpha-ketoglutarate-dependent dioxygenase AlkB [Acidobacteriota bacterium]